MSAGAKIICSSSRAQNRRRASITYPGALNPSLSAAGRLRVPARVNGPLRRSHACPPQASPAEQVVFCHEDPDGVRIVWQALPAGRHVSGSVAVTRVPRP